MVALFLSVFLLPFTQTPVTLDELTLAENQSLIGEERFAEAETHARELVQRYPGNPEALYLLGFALAKQGKWPEARERLEDVLLLDPDYVPAYLELAGIAFEESEYDRAGRQLERALALDPADPYTLDFLATVLYLEGDEITALHYWNQVDEPRVNQIAFRAGRRLDPALLEGLFAFNEGEVLRKEGVLDTRWKQARLALDPPFQLNLTPDATAAWDLEVILPPRSLLSFTRDLLLRNGLRAPLYREIELAYPIELDSGWQVSGALRWDPKQKQLQTSAWIPFLTGWSDGLRFGLDLREEDWRHTASDTRYVQQSEQFTAGYEYVFTGRRSISFGGGYEHQFLRLTGDERSSYSPHLLQLAAEWNQRIALNDGDTVGLDLRGRYESFTALGDGQTARKLSGTMRLPWLIDRRNDTRLELSVGGGFGNDNLPLNHYFVFGVGQDQPLQLRAHPTVENGYKGHGPMGRNYGLLNLELQHRLFDWKTLNVTGMVFSDTATVGGGPFGTQDMRWYQDIGVGTHIGALGRDLLNLRLGVDLKTSAFNLWIGLPE